MGRGAICNSPDSSIGAFHIHFHFQENISAETGILGTFAGAFRRVEPGLRSQKGLVSRIPLIMGSMDIHAAITSSVRTSG